MERRDKNGLGSMFFMILVPYTAIYLHLPYAFIFLLSFFGGYWAAQGKYGELWERAEAKLLRKKDL